METIIFLMVLSLSIFIESANDPSAGIFRDRQDARNLDCVRLGQAEAHARYPAEVPAPPARGTAKVTDAVACTRRFMRHGERPARDELILSSLRQTVGGLVQTARAAVPATTPVTWHVDAFYPDANVAAKISVAAKTELVEHGLQVSDRVPLLAAGDIAVLGRLPPKEAYSLACARYFTENILADDHVFLGLMIVDAREGQLHAGLCERGQWKWLR